MGLGGGGGVVTTIRWGMNIDRMVIMRMKHKL
jgi:hypothetical protein